MAIKRSDPGQAVKLLNKTAVGLISNRIQSQQPPKVILLCTSSIGALRALLYACSVVFTIRLTVCAAVGQRLVTAHDRING